VSRRRGQLPRTERTNLPAELTPFVDRDVDVGVLTQQIQDTRLLSLLGPAGIGKTRLALRIASTVRRQFQDGVWWVQLAPVTDSELLPSVIAGVLAIPEARPGETLAVLDAALSARHMLLVLDNCEHLVDAVAVVVDHLLQFCHKLTVLTTSRERIGLVGESIWRVSPLGLPELSRPYPPDELERVEAVALFVERARRANPRFAIVPSDAGHVVDLVRRLDGMPLAVELAAAWMETLSPEELARELDDRYRFLVGKRLVSDRHPGLWAAIESSYDRLDDAAQSLLRQLGVFAGGWNLGAMTSVCRLESGAAVEVLGRLVDHSFVEVVPTKEGPTRYRMLEVLRRFALDKLEETGHLEATTGRLADYVASMAERASPSLTGREGPRWLAMLDADLANVRAVFATRSAPAHEPKRRLAVSMVPYWLLRGLMDEGRGHLGEVVDQVGPVSPAAVAVLNGLSWLSWAQGDLGMAARRARGAFRAARRAGDRRGAANALLRLAQAQFDAARPATAGRTTHHARHIASDLADQRLVAECALQLGQVALVEGRLEEAERSVSESVRLLTEAGPVYRRSNAQVTLGRVFLYQGRVREAEEVLRESLAVASELAMVRPTVPILESLAAVAADRGDSGRAARLAGAAAGLLERTGAQPPTTAPMRAAIVARWQPALRAPGAARAFAEGRGMATPHAIAYALGGPMAVETRSTRPAPRVRQVLTNRQLTVARLVAQGLSNKEIANRLVISDRTAEGHVEQIFNRLGFNSRAQIAAWVVKHDEGA
jgi:non-specific serine/threonine protein kinase